MQTIVITVIITIISSLFIFRLIGLYLRNKFKKRDEKLLSELENIFSYNLDERILMRSGSPEKLVENKYWQAQALLRNTKGETSAGAYMALEYVHKYLNFTNE